MRAGCTGLVRALGMRATGHSQCSLCPQPGSPHSVQGKQAQIRALAATHPPGLLTASALSKSDPRQTLPAAIAACTVQVGMAYLL